jgi:addiction module HigA family antidote
MLPELKLQISELAELLQFPDEEMWKICNGQAPISLDLALSLQRAGLSTAGFWLRVQRRYDVWQAGTFPT